ncbi:conjugal transfer protein [Streptacidiphilus sp. EB103A]|uniref:conjugal transfer protein n=1 Tax=Streptacidiphilus sp. EB103A TaxID=3156275 RepID=UPI0035135269
MAGLRKMLNLPERAPKPDKAPSEEPGAPHERGRSGGAMWEEEAESGARSAARGAGRLLIWAVIGLLALSGLRTWIFPAKSAHAPAPAPSSSSADQVPTAEAQQVAAQFARSYMSWDSSDPQMRASELAADLPQGADPKMGWNGSGYESAAQTIPGAVTQLGGGRARVSVDVRVSVTATVGGKQIVTNGWRGLQVPVAEARGRVIVTGQPALVGLPGPIAYTVPAPPDPDNALTGATTQTVQQFLTAWAAGNQGQAAAPGAVILPLGGSISLSSLDGWTVDAGTGSKRYGTATVTWNLAGAQLQQTYRVVLLQVVAGGATAWQVDGVTAAG